MLLSFIIIYMTKVVGEFPHFGIMYNSMEFLYIYLFFPVKKVFTLLILCFRMIFQLIYLLLLYANFFLKTAHEFWGICPMIMTKNIDNRI